MNLRTRALGLPIIAGLVGIVGLRRARSRRRPSVDDLMAMDGPTFESFVRLTGLEDRVAKAMARADDVAG